MSPATLYREGSDLDELLAELDAQYPRRVRVLDIARPREGGVFGFFAKQRVGVHYRLLEAPETASAASLLAHDVVSAPRRPAATTAGDVVVGSRPRKAADAPARAALSAPSAARGSAVADRRRAGFAAPPAATGARVLADAVVAAEVPDTRGGDTRGQAVPATPDTDAGTQFAQILAELALRTATRREADTAAAPESAAGQETPRAADDLSGIDDADRSDFAPAAFTQAAFAPAAETLAAPATGTPAPARRRSPRAVPQFLPAPGQAPLEPAAPTPAAPASEPAAQGTEAATATNPRPGALNWPLAGPGVAAVVAPLSTAAVATHPAPASVLATVDASEQLPWALPVQQDSCHDQAADSGPLSRAPESQHHHSRRLALRRQLAELGVAIGRVPDDADHVYAAVEQLVRDLPPVPRPPADPGQILVIAGPARDAVIAAETLSTGTAAAFADVWSYGCPAGIHTRRSTSDRVIDSAGTAAALAADLRATGGPATVVVVATDALHRTNTAAEVIAALAPDATWAVVDATRKPSDSRRALGHLGAVDAIVVANAELSASPATVWDLGLPMALVDGRPAGPSTWAVLLVSRVSEMKEQECSVAPY